MGRLVSRRRPARGVTQKRYGSRARSRNVLRARQWQRSNRNGGACAHEGLDRGRSPQSVGRRRCGGRGRRVPRACYLPTELRRLEVPRTLGETVPRASLGGGEHRRPRSAPGGEVGSGRRVRGGRAAEAFGAGAGALDRQRPQEERRARRPRHRLGSLAQRAAGSGRSRGHLGAAAPPFREARGPGGRAYAGAQGSLHGLLRDLVPGGVGGTLSAHRAARILRGVRPQGASSRVRRRLASEILRDVRTLDRKIANLNERIEAEVEASDTALTEIFGIGPILAARIIGTVGNVARFPTKGHFASYSGVAPVEASSGEVVRHKLSLAGNRKLNYAL